MVRKVRKAMAFLLAFALVFSMVRTDQLSVRAETAAETETSQEENVSVQSEEKENEASEEEGDSTPNSEEAPEVPEGSVDDGTGDPAGNTDIADGTGSGNNGSQNGNEPTTPPVSGEAEDGSSTTAVDPTAPTTPSTSEAVSEEVTSEVNTEETSTEESAEETSEEASTEETSEAETETETATEGETGDEAEELVEKTVRAEVFADGSYSRSADGGTEITLTGVMPEEATVKAYPVEVQIDDAVVLSAYDITIFDGDGEVYQPEDGAIQVKIEDAAVREAVEEDKEISVYHMEDEGAAPEEVGGVAKEDNAVVFDAESFSIYIVTEPDETHYTHTYIFYDGDEELGKQILSTGEVLNAPETPAKEGYAFTGWYTELECRNEFKGFGAEEGELSEDITTKLYAGFTEVFYVFYMSEAGEDGYVLYTQHYKNGDTVLWQDVPFNTGNTETALIGWSTQPEATEPEQNLIVNGADITLYPVVASAHWITYHSMGGSAVDPTYVLAGNNTKAPDSPTRMGYVFQGWYLDEECTQPFTFGNMLTSSIDLYAKWQGVETEYKVVYWLENAEDDDYSFDAVVERRGITGEDATYADRSSRYPGFELNEEKTAEAAVTIAGDGTTIRNVYYQRKTYTLTFQIYKSSGWFGGDWETEYSRSGIKYGQSVQPWWDEAEDEIGTNYLWYTTKNGSTFYTAPPTMPNGNLTVYGRTSGGRSVIYYYEYRTTNQIREPFYVNDTGWSFTEEDYIEIPGFTYSYSEEPELSWGGYIGNYEIYYTRNAYDIEFITNGGAPVNTIKDILYEADISNRAPRTYVVNQTTKVVDGITWYFAGWYDNEALAGEAFDFRGQEMPAKDLALYAKWVAKTVTVEFDTDGGTQIDSVTIAAGTAVNRPEDPERTGYAFAGWTWEDGTPFNFNTLITEDTTIYAQWISDDEYMITYQPWENAVEDEMVIDPKGYADGAKAKVMAVPEGWDAPEGYEGFICWVDETGAEYYPGDLYEMPAHNVVLTARWASTRETTLTYDFNGGTGKGGSERYIEVIELPNDQYSIKTFAGEEAITKPGYQFAGWTKSADGSGQILNANDIIEVDTLSEEENILYAKWVKSVKITVKKLVSGTMGQVDGTFNFTFTVEDEDGKQAGDFTLTSGGSYSIENLEAGQKVIIKETSANTDGYQTYVYPENGQKPTETGDSCEIVIDEDTQDITIIFENYRQVTPPTGIHDNVIPFSMMLLTAAAGTVWFGLLGRRKRSA